MAGERSQIVEKSENFGHRDTEGIEWRVIDGTNQHVDIDLDPGEAVIGEAGAMLYKTANITMSTVLGDGSEDESAGMLSKIASAGKRLVTGEGVFMTAFSNEGESKGRVGLAASVPGSVIPIALQDRPESAIICQSDAFLGGLKGVSIGLELKTNVFTGLFGGEGIFLQRVEGEGEAFLHVGGDVRTVRLKEEQTLHVDTGCLAAYETTVGFETEYVGGIKSAVFGGEGFMFAKLTGPGQVWLQTLPFPRLVHKINEALPKSSDGGGGELEIEGGEEEGGEDGGE